MAKRQKVKRFSIQAFDNAHYKATENYVRAVDALFDAATKDISNNAAKLNTAQGKAFRYDDFPSFKKQMQKTIDGLAQNVTTTIETGSRKQWLYACDKNDAFIASIMDTSKLKKSTLKKMQDRNLDALATFQTRKVNGMNLSTRVWNYVGQYKDQMEQALDVGLGEGRSAQQLARDVKQNLKDPSRLFRRVRDKRGNLVLSKNAKAFHPGTGVYRSSVKNAQRLTRSEINMAYRESDFRRWQLLDFVVGFDVVRSNHEPLCKCKLCEQLKGKYPKAFEFKGWHPQCMCYAIPILADEKTINDNEADELKAALRGTSYTRREAPNKVNDVPQGFKDWCDANKSNTWKSTPYFVRDNFKNGNIADGLKFAVGQQATQMKATTRQEQDAQDIVPEELRLGSDYLRGENYAFDEDFFALFEKSKFPSLQIDQDAKTSYATWSGDGVVLANGSRLINSHWKRKSVVYHEYGHCIDAHRKLWQDAELKDMRQKQIAWLKGKTDKTLTVRKYDYDKHKYVYIKQTYKSRVAYIDARLQELDRKIYNMKASIFDKYNISKADVQEQILAVRDTIKSLVIKYGEGHSTSYFKRLQTKETEYLAHAFENTFIGNRVFQKMMPDIYDEMIQYIKALKKP